MESKDLSDAILVQLVDSLQQHGSWCGETHVQKCAYLLQQGLGINCGLQFVLYKHGPFSFPLRNTLERLVSADVLRIEPRPAPYGPSLGVGDNWVRAHLDEETNERIDYIARTFGPKGVAELERLATALYVKKNSSNVNSAELVAEIVKLKPHVSPDLASLALQQVTDSLSST